MDGGLQRIEGVMIGVLTGFEAGAPLITFPGTPPETALPARSLVALDAAALGAEVAVAFEAGDPTRPLILGRIVEPTPAPEIFRDGARVRVTAEERIELRVGKASLILEKDGHITLRGSYVTGHASAALRLRGGSINLN